MKLYWLRSLIGFERVNPQTSHVDTLWSLKLAAAVVRTAHKVKSPTPHFATVADHFLCRRYSDQVGLGLGSVIARGETGSLFGRRPRRKEGREERRWREKNYRSETTLFFFPAQQPLALSADGGDCDCFLSQSLSLHDEPRPFAGRVRRWE